MLSISNQQKEALKEQIEHFTNLVSGAVIPLFTGYIEPVAILNKENTSFLQKRVSTILDREKSNFHVIKNNRDNPNETAAAPDFIEFPIHDLLKQVKLLLEEVFKGKIISEYVLLAKAARIDRHQDYESDYFVENNKYRVPIGVSIFLGPDDGSPFQIYYGDNVITQNVSGTLVAFGATVEHGHPLGHDSYYIVYQPTFEFEIDCGC